MPLDQVIAKSTWAPAKAIKHESLGHLSAGAVADVAVLRVEKGTFGFIDQNGARRSGTQKLTAEMTVKDGKIVYDLNGLASPEWSTAPSNYGVR
jgi:dihydroorotase